MRWIIAIIILGSCAVSTSCESGRYAGRGFRLPKGDAERGQAAFVARGCADCHTVPGVDLPAPKMQPPAVAVMLGGPTPNAITDAYLFTSIVNPNYTLAKYSKQQVTIEGHSRMPSFAERMTTQEITDIVEFLQGHYRVRDTMAKPAYY